MNNLKKFIYMKIKLLLLVLLTTILPIDVEKAESEIVLHSDKIKLETILQEQVKEWIVTATTYNPVKAQTNSDPTLTADMSRIDLNKLKKGKIKWIAISRDFLKRGDFKYGDRVEIECSQRPDLNGIYEIHDTMNKRLKNKIDILQDVSEKGGLFKKVKIRKVKEERI